MSKFSKFLLILFLIILTACNRPQSDPNGVPSDSDISDGSADTPQGITMASETQPSSSEDQITTTPEIPDSTDGVPAEPTIDMTQALAGYPIQLYSAGTEINLVEISMVNTKAGWGIGGSDPDNYHIFTTDDGGLTWQDVSPPQPGIAGTGAYIYVEYGVWDEHSAWVAYSGAEYIWATHDGGVSWEASPVVFTSTGDGMFEVLDADHVWFFQFLEGGMQKIFTAVNRSSDGGSTWEMILSPYEDATIQSFTKTGLDFISPQYGWLTRDFRGVDPYVRVNFSEDGGITWDAVEIPPPPPLPDLFQSGLGDLFDPYLIAPGEGYFRLFSRHFENDVMIDRDFLYKTSDSGLNWEILETPGGDIYYIDDQVLYSVSRDIYRSVDSGLTWQKVKSVSWDGNFSFIDKNTAWGIAYDPDDNEYALVKTIDGCKSFIIIEPKLLEPGTIR